MVQLATCSYGEFKPDMGVPVRISLGLPRYPTPWLDPQRKVWTLTPRFSYFNLPVAEFDREFYAQLDTAGVDSILHDLEAVDLKAGGGNLLVLLCFEKLGAKSHQRPAGMDVWELEASICHRRMFAAWWHDRTGEEIPELGSRALVVEDTPSAAEPLF